MKMGSEPLLRVLCITDDSQLGSLVRETLATSLPSSIVDVEESEYVQPDLLSGAVCMVLDSQLHSSAGVDALRRYRAAGFSGAAVLLLADPAPGVAMRAASLGAPLTVLKREIPARLPAAVTAAARPVMSPGEWSVLYAELRRTQRLIALGHIAGRLRHDLANPMTVVTSELLMLNADPALPERYRETVTELLVMCRRVGEVIRELDAFVKVEEPLAESDSASPAARDDPDRQP